MSATDFEALFRGADLTSITTQTPIPEIAARIRNLCASLNGTDTLGRATIRSMLLEFLREAKIPGGAAIVDAAFTVTKPAETAVQGSAFTFAPVERWPEPVDGDELLRNLVRTFTRFVVLPEGGATAAALWALHAHAHNAAHISANLNFSSPEKGCGKTTALHVISALVPRPLSAANISAAALFRAVEKFRPTLLIDEADTFIQDREELRGILNSGHTRATAVVVRTAGDDFEPRMFSTWCPKAVALIGNLPATLEDRSIVIPMRRRARSERVERLRLDRLSELEPLRRQAARWAADHMAALPDAEPALPDTLRDRSCDNWRALVAIADLAGGPWPERARKAAVLLSGRVDEGEQAPAIQLLADIRAAFDGKEAIASGDLVEVLTAREDRPWVEWKHGRPLTARQLARLLGRFGIAPKQLWIAGAKVRGYALEVFGDAFARYLPSDPVGAVEPSNRAEKHAFEDRVEAARLPDRKNRANPDGGSTLPLLPDGNGDAGPYSANGEPSTCPQGHKTEATSGRRRLCSRCDAAEWLAALDAEVGA